jgi:hypothetical protein
MAKMKVLCSEENPEYAWGIRRQDFAMSGLTVISVGFLLVEPGRVRNSALHRQIHNSTILWELATTTWLSPCQNVTWLRIIALVISLEHAWHKNAPLGFFTMSLRIAWLSRLDRKNLNPSGAA